jgi:hypothetical protein
MFIHNNGMVIVWHPPTKVFDLACRILEGKTPSTSLTVVQTTVDSSTTEDLEDVGRRRAKLAAEAIATFDVYDSDGHNPTTSYDSPASTRMVIVWHSPAKVFYLAGRILEGKTSSTSLTLVQATVDSSMTEDFEVVRRRRAKLAAEVIATFDVYASDGHDPTTSHDSPASTRTTYLFNVYARHARERRGIRLGVIRMVNDSVLAVSWARSKTLRVGL